MLEFWQLILVFSCDDLLLRHSYLCYREFLRELLDLLLLLDQELLDGDQSLLQLTYCRNKGYNTF